MRYKLLIFIFMEGGSNIKVCTQAPHKLVATLQINCCALNSFKISKIYLDIHIEIFQLAV